MKTRALLACGSVLLALVAGACDTETGPPEPDPTGTAKNPVKLSFLAYGPEEEVAAMQSTVDNFNADNPTTHVKLVQADEPGEVIDQLKSKTPPDVYLLSQRDLAEVSKQGLNQPLEELLDSRGVDFGDFYKRDSVEAFSVDSRLQCMPYGVSPMVMYYNSDLIDWDTMKEKGLDAPASHSAWTLSQFAAAAEFASSRPGAKGVYIEPTLEGIAPFIYSGDGQLFDDQREPTTLALSEDSSREALVKTMDILRSDKLTLTPRQLRKESALSRFKTGKLGMIAGYRNLVPELRKTPSLNFDVMPMPTLDNNTTVGDVSGLCISADPKSVSAAADFIVDMISGESVARVAEAGYLVPSNNEVSESDPFLQPDERPAHAEVFNRSVRDIVSPPLLDSWADLETAVHKPLYKLFYNRVLNLEELTDAIDEASKPVLENQAEPSETVTD